MMSSSSFSPYRSRYRRVATTIRSSGWPAVWTMLFQAVLTDVARTALWMPHATHALSTTTRASSSLPSSFLISQLRNPNLLQHALCQEGPSSFPVHNPAAAAKDDDDPSSSPSILAHVPRHTVSDARAAMDRATKALPAWRDGTTAVHRSTRLTRWSAALQAHAQDLATILSLESGKPLRESLAEVQYGRSFLDYYAAECLRPNGFTVPSPFVSTEDGSTPRGQVLVTTEAVGVVAMITPWNFPLAMICRKVGPALAAGCTAIVKPSELTPLTALALQQLAEEDGVGIPKGVLQTLPCTRHDTVRVGQEFCTNSAVHKISFTGSTAVGKQLMEWSSRTVQRLSLELGGNAPFVIFDDADLSQAIEAAVASKFRNAGQTCVSADRFLVQEGVYDAFVEGFCRAVSELRIGSGLEETTNVGPLISEAAAKKVDDKVRKALQEGATCRLGGSPLPSLGPHFYQPTILTDVSTKSDIWNTETFGPVAAVRSFVTEEDALREANDSMAGLASYFCTKDLARVFRFSKNLQYGLVGVNEGVISTCYAPFGGVKESGLGREGSPLGLQEYLETKYTFLNT